MDLARVRHRLGHAVAEDRAQVRHRLRQDAAQALLVRGVVGQEETEAEVRVHLVAGAEVEPAPVDDRAAAQDEPDLLQLAQTEAADRKDACHGGADARDLDRLPSFPPARCARAREGTVGRGGGATVKARHGSRRGLACQQRSGPAADATGPPVRHETVLSASGCDAAEAEAVRVIPCVVEDERGRRGIVVVASKQPSKVNSPLERLTFSKVSFRTCPRRTSPRPNRRSPCRRCSWWRTSGRSSGRRRCC